MDTKKNQNCHKIMGQVFKKMSKIIKLQKLASKLKKLKKNKVVLCHGVFDIIHHGHIKYFEEAKKNGDILVVSLTADEFVNKGSGRPYFSFKFRYNLPKYFWL